MTVKATHFRDQSRMAHFCSYWLPPLILTAGILIMAGDLGSVSKFWRFVKIFEFFLTSYSHKEIYQIYLVVRKVGHFLAYGALFVAYARAWRWHLQQTRLKTVLLALAICFLVSAGDESRQALHPSRTGSVWDVVLDMSGALTAALILLPFLRPDVREKA
jgi:VanZ family protein